MSQSHLWFIIIGANVTRCASMEGEIVVVVVVVRDTVRLF